MIANIFSLGILLLLTTSSDCLQWQMGTPFPNGTIVFEASMMFASTVSKLTKGAFTINVVTGVGGLVANDVSAGKYEACHTVGYYLKDKNPAFSLASAVPFSMDAPNFNAWLYNGGGNDMYNTLLAKYNLIGFPAGNTGTQMGGFWKKPITGVNDVKGRRMRIVGLGAEVMQRLGMIVPAVPLVDIYPSLKNGSLDAAEWIGPAEDLRQRFNEVAKFYYYPAWWEPSALLHVMFNLNTWNALTADYQQALVQAAFLVDSYLYERYNFDNVAALDQLKQSGTTVLPFPYSLMQAAEVQTNLLLDSYATGNVDFTAMWSSIKSFKDSALRNQAVSSLSFDNYMYLNQLKQGKK